MKIVLAAILLAASFGVSATNNNPPNECGNHGNNCQPSGGTNNNEVNGGNGYGGSGGSSSSVGTGIGVGIGTGGTGFGGSGGEGGGGGDGGNAIAVGGSGGHGGDASSEVIGSGNSSAHGGDANAYGGNQSQGQHQSSTSVSGSKSVAQMASENTVNASSQNANNSQASGNTTVTNVGGDSTLVERNAPPVFLGAIMPSSCGGSIQAGASDRNGSGAFGFSWVGDECAIRMIGDRYQQLGMVDTACEVYRSTKAFQKAAKRNPKLADLDCSIKPAPVPVVVPALVAPEIAHRVPRG